MANLLLIDDDPDLLPDQVAHVFPAPAHRVEIARNAATSSQSRSPPQAGSGSGTAWSPVTAGWRSRDEPGGGGAVDSFAPSLTLVLPIGDDTAGNTQIYRNG